MFKRKLKQATVEYDSDRLRPALKSSICTGEKVAGFVDKENPL